MLVRNSLRVDVQMAECDCLADFITRSTKGCAFPESGMKINLRMSCIALSVANVLAACTSPAVQAPELTGIGAPDGHANGDDD